MVRYIIASFVLVTFICFSGGCVVRHGDFTVLSNKLINVTDFELEKSDRIKGIEGKDVQHIVIFIPIGGPPTLEGALDDAFEKGGGDVMTDAVVKAGGFYIPYIYGKFSWKVKGDVVKTRKK